MADYNLDGGIQGLDSEPLREAITNFLDFYKLAGRSSEVFVDKVRDKVYRIGFEFEPDLSPLVIGRTVGFDFDQHLAERGFARVNGSLSHSGGVVYVSPVEAVRKAA